MVHGGMGGRWAIRCGAAVLLAAALLATALAPGAARAQEPAIELDAGAGNTLRIERAPFRLVLVGSDGSEQVSTVPAGEGPPVRVPGIDGPLPVEPLGALGGFPALGFVVGASPGVTFPVGFFSGNRLFGAEAGAIVSVTGVASSRVVAGGLELELTTDAPGTGNATLSVQTLPGGGVALDLRPPPGLQVSSTTFTLASPPDEGLYGLGARKDVFDQRGRLRNIWVEQQNASDERLEGAPGADPTGTTGPQYTFPNGAQAAYYVQAALFGSRGWAAWVGDTELSRVDLAVSREDAVRWGVATSGLRLSLAGGGLERASQSFTAVAGRAPAPPRYVYEPWVDILNEGEGEAAPNGARFDGGPRVKADVQEVVRMKRELDLPIGTIGVEGWHKVPGKETFFPALRKQGFHLAAYWNPFTAPNSEAYGEALAKGLFIEDPNGEPYPIVTNRNNLSYVIDFSNPGAQDFWKAQLDRSNALGFEAFMHDFGEFVTEGMIFHNGDSTATMHNKYPVLYHRAARRAVEAYAAEHPGHEPWFYVRAGYSQVGAEPGVTGSTSGVFPGDETTDWAKGSGLPSVVPAMLNLALGGSYTFTTDVGGYLDLIAPRTTPELFVRWSQLAAFTPVSRVHNSTGGGSFYPWELDEAGLDAYRRYAKAKVKLIPLVDRFSQRAARDGSIGPVRPLVLEDPSPEARSVGDEWLVGRDLLVAPILKKGARSRRVYLPAGAQWERVTVAADGSLAPTGKVAAGGSTVTAPAPLADIPLYRRVTAADEGGQVPVADDRDASTRRGGRGGRRGAGAQRARTGAVGVASGSLPFTGLDLRPPLLAGLMLLGTGLALRRRA